MSITYFSLFGLYGLVSAFGCLVEAGTTFEEAALDNGFILIFCVLDLMRNTSI